MTRFGLSIEAEDASIEPILSSRLSIEHRAEPKLKAEYRASGTDSKSTTAEHRTHNLSVPSGYATCYATKILFTEYRYVKSDLVDFTTLRDFTYIHISSPISIASMGVTF